MLQNIIHITIFPCKIAISPEVDVLKVNPEAKDSSNIRGADILQQTQVTVTNSPQLFEWRGFGLKLNIPAQVLPGDLDSCIITIKVSFSGQYRFPANMELVSSVFWLSCHPACKFETPLTLEVQHCAPLKNSSCLVLARALCTQEELPYTFKVLHGAVFSTHSSYGVIDLNRFSGICGLQEGSDERCYWSGVFYIGPPKHREIHFAVTWDDDSHITVSINVHWNL